MPASLPPEAREFAARRFVRMHSDARSREGVAKTGPAKWMGRDLRRVATVAVLGGGLLALGIADHSAPAVAQFKPGTPAETLSFAEIVERVKPAVVSVSTTNEVKVADKKRTPGGPGGPGGGGGQPFEGIPGL